VCVFERVFSTKSALVVYIAADFSSSVSRERGQVKLRSLYSIQCCAIGVYIG
jgi:hypothetical protein